MSKRLILLLALVLAPSATAGSSPPQQGIVHASGGASLYAANCARCHGPQGRGQSGQGPSLRDAGALAADFYLRTGYMPLERPAEQPTRSRVLFSDDEIRAMVAYVASLGDGPEIPTPHPERGDVAAGAKTFRENCAGCHQIVAEGGYVTGGRVPALEDATPRQIAQAIRIGPYLMPRFDEKQLDDEEVDSLIAYVQYAKHPNDPGGLSLGHLGPWPEGAVTWLVAAAALVALCVVIGKRLQS